MGRFWMVATALLTISTGLQVSAQQPSASQAQPPSTDEAKSHAEPTDLLDASVPVPETAPPAPRMRLGIIDAATYDIDPIVGRHVNARIRKTGIELGYDITPKDEMVHAAQSIDMAYPPAPSDLWRAAYASKSQRGIFAKVWAKDGRYVVEIVVASLDGKGPFFRRGSAPANHLHELVAALVKTVLPTPSQWNEAAAMRQREAQSAPRAAPPIPPRSKAVQRRKRRVRLQAPGRRWDFIVQTEAGGVLGAPNPYTHFAGLRLNLRLTETFMVGIHVAYANLPGRDNRASNILPYLQFENRIRVSRHVDVTIPIKAAIGYLPYNGAVLRFAGGLNIPLSDRWELGADIFTPTIYFLRERTLTTFTVGLELLYRL